MEKSTELFDLPDDVLLLILAFCEYDQDSIRLTCKAFHTLALPKQLTVCNTKRDLERVAAIVRNEKLSQAILFLTIYPVSLRQYPDESDFQNAAKENTNNGYTYSWWEESGVPEKYSPLGLYEDNKAAVYERYNQLQKQEQQIDWERAVREVVRLPNLQQLWIRWPSRDQLDDEHAIMTYAPTIILPAIQKNLLGAVFTHSCPDMTMKVPWNTFPIGKKTIDEVNGGPVTDFRICVLFEVEDEDEEHILKTMRRIKECRHFLRQEWSLAHLLWKYQNLRSIDIEFDACTSWCQPANLSAIFRPNMHFKELKSVRFCRFRFKPQRMLEFIRLHSSTLTRMALAEMFIAGSWWSFLQEVRALHRGWDHFSVLSYNNNRTECFSNQYWPPKPIEGLTESIESYVAGRTDELSLAHGDFTDLWSCEGQD